MACDRQLISDGDPMETIVRFSRADRLRPYLCVGGTAPVGADGKTVGVGDVAARTRQCLDSSRRPWNRPGPAFKTSFASVNEVIRTRIIPTDLDDWKAAIDVRKEYFRDIRPVDTIMVVRHGRDGNRI